MRNAPITVRFINQITRIESSAIILHMENRFQVRRFPGDIVDVEKHKKKNKRNWDYIWSWISITNSTKQREKLFSWVIPAGELYLIFFFDFLRCKDKVLPDDLRRSYEKKRKKSEFIISGILITMSIKHQKFVPPSFKRTEAMDLNFFSVFWSATMQFNRYSRL